MGADWETGYCMAFAVIAASLEYRPRCNLLVYIACRQVAKGFALVGAGPGLPSWPPVVAYDTELEIVLPTVGYPVW